MAGVSQSSRAMTRPKCFEVSTERRVSLRRAGLQPTEMALGRSQPPTPHRILGVAVDEAGPTIGLVAAPFPLPPLAGMVVHLHRSQFVTVC